MRAATVLGIEPNKLWLQILPMQIVGIVIALATAFIWGNIEKRRGAGTEEVMEKAALEMQEEEEEAGMKESDLARPQNFIFNLILTLVVIACLIFVKVPSYYVFMIGCVIALFVNYPGAKLQNKIIKSHSGPAIMMASTILSAGVFLGVMEQSEIMMHMANVLAGLIPQSMGRFLPIIIGLLAVPLTLLFDTDTKEGCRHDRTDKCCTVTAYNHNNRNVCCFDSEFSSDADQDRHQTEEERVGIE